MNKKLSALGRLKPGQMNKTEQAYCDELERQKISGEILWYRFEGMTFKLANDTRYTPDFNVLLVNGELECREVKGAPAIFQDDAKVKIKMASALFPMRFVAVFPIPKKDGGGWRIKDFS